MYLIRLKPFQNESLLSYLKRSASANKISIFDLLKDIKRKNCMVRTDRIHLVDIYPYSFLDLDLLTERTKLKLEEILQMTYHYALLKFNHSERDSYSRVMKGIIRHQAYFCPECLSENKYLRLKWKLSELDVCLKHNCYLVSFCTKCNSQLDTHNLDYRNCCPQCKEILESAASEAIRDKVHLSSQFWLDAQWNKLIEASIDSYTPQEVAQKIIFLIQGNYPDITLREGCKNINLDYQELMQNARNTQTIRRSIHLSKLLNILLQLNFNVEVFLSIQPTIPFIESIKNVEMDNYKESVCIAPWCSHYQLRGQLKETGTKYKRLKDGKIQKKYSFCPHCGCTYFFNASGEQIERDGFIKGFYGFKEAEFLSSHEFAGLTTLNSKKTEAYFRTRTTSQYKKLIDECLLNRFIYALQNYVGLNQIREWKCWVSDEEYLMYRYHIDILRIRHSVKRKIGARIDYDAKYIELREALDEFNLSNKSINLNQIAKAIGMSSITLRSWNKGYDAYLFAKRKKKAELLKEWKDDKYTIIDNFLSLNNEKIILVKDVYNLIQVRQSYLLNVSPEMTTYISIEIKEHNAKLEKR